MFNTYNEAPSIRCDETYSYYYMNQTTPKIDLNTWCKCNLPLEQLLFTQGIPSNNVDIHGRQTVSEERETMQNCTPSLLEHI
jgi:hypothetical protein